MVRRLAVRGQTSGHGATGDGLCTDRMPGWPAGVYEGPGLLRTALIVLSELPRERSS
ncbi:MULTISPECIES: hypothetical protein [Sorangium]|uniref:hypothetical protein n=1 Tax=Sorangium TaxID=39643 RepID=UPI003D9C16D9